MAKRKSQKEYVQQVAELFPNIQVVGEYKGVHSKIKCICKECGKEWEPYAGNILKGRGCGVCSKKSRKYWNQKTHDDFVQEMRIKNPNIEVMGAYAGANKRITVKCLICNNIWNPTAASLSAGSGCPYCSGRIKWDTDSFKHEVENLNPSTEVLGEYTRSTEKILCRCRLCGHMWEAKASHLTAGHGCPRCADHMRTSFQEQAILFYARQYFQGVVNRWNDCGFELDVYIESKKVGIEYDGTPWHRDKIDRDNAKDELCKRNNIQLIRIRDIGLTSTESAINIIMSSQSMKELSRCIENAFSKITIDHYDIDIERDQNDIIMQYKHDLRSDSLAVEHPELLVEWDYSKNGDLNPKNVASKSHTKVWWKCGKCGYEWYGRIDHRTSGHGCAKCAGVIRKTSEEFEEELHRINPNIIPMEKYEKRDKKIECKCKQCGNIWFPYPSNLLKGSGCPVCSKKKAAEKRRKK